MFNLFDATIVIFSSVFIMQFSTNWVSLHSVYVSLVAISLIISLILPESPKFLVSRKQYDRAFEAYNFIGKMNKTGLCLNHGLHRFKEQKNGDKKALRRHFKRVQYDISRGIGM